MVAELRDICATFSDDDFDVTVFHPFFVFIDQYLAILPQTAQCVLGTALVMVLIALLFIPSIVCSLWVSLSIVSIEFGVIGFMSHWGVNLDGVSLINLIMCIGFSVDFSAHISYHYMTERNKSPDERIRGSLYALGIPILQGAGSTILGVVGLAFAPSYLFVTFFKMIFLVIVLGALHGLVLLPVLLSLLGPGSCESVFGSKKRDKFPTTTNSLNSSGLSTPTTISCHRAHPSSCYTVNLGFVPDYNSSPMSSSVASSSTNPCQNPRHQRQRQHHRHHQRHNSTALDSVQLQKLDYLSSLPNGYMQPYGSQNRRRLETEDRFWSPLVENGQNERQRKDVNEGDAKARYVIYKREFSARLKNGN